MPGVSGRGTRISRAADQRLDRGVGAAQQHQLNVEPLLSKKNLLRCNPERAGAHDFRSHRLRSPLPVRKYCRIRVSYFLLQPGCSKFTLAPWQRNGSRAVFCRSIGAISPIYKSARTKTEIPPTDGISRQKGDRPRAEQQRLVRDQAFLKGFARVKLLQRANYMSIHARYPSPAKPVNKVTGCVPYFQAKISGMLFLTVAKGINFSIPQRATR